MDSDYLAYEEKPTSPPQQTDQCALQCEVLTAHDCSREYGGTRLVNLLLAVGLGIGSHASSESLAPTEPTLEALGLGEVAYALLSIAPVCMGIATPLLWGALWDRAPWWVMLAAPLGEASGAFCTAAGLRAMAPDVASEIGLVQAAMMNPTAGVLLLLGVLLFSVSKAGVAIAQHSLVGQLFSGSQTTLAFAVLIVCKHLISILASWFMPRVVARAASDLLGLLNVQLVTLIPHSVSVTAGGVLCALHIGPRAVSRASEPSVDTPPAACTGLSRGAYLTAGQWRSALPQRRRWGRMVGWCSSLCLGNRKSPGRAMRVVIGIGIWRAVTVGTLHAYHATRVQMLVSIGTTAIAAGARCAFNDLLAIAALPAFALLARLVGLRSLLSLGPLVTAAATLLLLLSAHHPQSFMTDPDAAGSVPEVNSPAASMLPGADVLAVDGLDIPIVAPALLAISMMEIFLPIIPLALLPANAGKLGHAYGTLEAVFVLVQTVIVLSVGFMREGSGFSGALGFETAAFVCAAAISLPLSAHAKYPHASTLCTEPRGSELLFGTRSKHKDVRS